MGSEFHSSKYWRKLRETYINNNPVCVFCMQLGIIKAGEIVDHIKPVATHPELALEWDNLQTLCKRCHDSAKQRIEHGKAGGWDENGLAIE